MIEEREELTNQECRDLKGSLSNRGCYFKDGKPLDAPEGATSCSCLDCARPVGIKQAFSIVEEVKGRTVVRPICSSCNLRREGL